MKLSAKFKKIPLSGFRATLNFQLVKVVLNPLHRIFLNFAERLSWYANYISEIKNGGH